MSASAHRWVWMDLEMTGLNPDQDLIIEMATIITDSELNIIAIGPETVIYAPPARFDLMDQWNQETHTRTGLWSKVLVSKTQLAEAEALTLAFIKAHTKEKESPLCGNSVWQDRRFLARHMPAIESYLHYRLVDVSTLKILYKAWHGAEPKAPKNEAHRALDDIKASIEELAFYRQNFLHVP